MAARTPSVAPAARSKAILGLRANWRQFALLVAINALVGAMVGIERSVLPLLAEEKFGLVSKTAIGTFVAAFGISKAAANLYAGSLSERVGRRRVLIAGWLFALPVPFMIILAPSWGWVVAANVLLGINQGLAWSMTVNMKIDLTGPGRRGFALGINEAAGYLSVAAAAYLAGVVAENYGISPEPFYLGIAVAAIGLALSALFARDTAEFVRAEQVEVGASSHPASLTRSFAEATWRRPYLVGATQAGFVNNLNDGLAWAVLPLFFAAAGLSLERVGLLAATYPLVWGSAQLGTGWLSDITGRRPLIVAGMLLQGVAISAIAFGDSFSSWAASVAVLGLGTAMVYPTLLAAIGDAVRPSDRATTLGVYRFWRDSGAMAGALLGGAVADIFGFEAAIQFVAALTVLSGVAAAAAMRRPPTRP